MACTVVKKSPAVLVAPAGPTPGGVLPLSSIDRCIAAGHLADTVQLFHPQPSAGTRVNAMAALRRGLSRALVPYYPVAGRLTPCDRHVDCRGPELGVWLVEAAASCHVEAVLDGRVSGEHLLPGADKLGKAVLMAQLTRFSCGGVVVGVIFSHAVLGGHGGGQFLTAVGELARGATALSVTPVWARDAIPADIAPPRRAPTSKPPLPEPGKKKTKLVSQVFDISPDSIAKLRKEYLQLTKESCTSFDALTAMVFKCRALALLATDDECYLDELLRLGFAVGTQRHVLPGVEGYYGNLGNTARVQFPAREAMALPLPELVMAIRDAKEKLEARVAKWIARGSGNGSEYFDPAPWPADYGTVVVSDARRLGYNDVDYGFGEPSYVFPANYYLGFGTVFYVKPPKPKLGVRLVLRCVRETHAGAFAAELAKFGSGTRDDTHRRSRI